MNVTKTTLDWYRQKVEPRWAKRVLAKDRKISIHEVINSQSKADNAKRLSLASDNLLNICRLYRKRGEILSHLWDIAYTPGTIIDPERRAAFARKWARRIEKSRLQKNS